MTDHAALADLATFARIEVESRDVEPWADLLAVLAGDGTLSLEEAHWVVKAYNAFDDMGSAWRMVYRWPTPEDWLHAQQPETIVELPCTQERRNLRGGKVRIHYDSYVHALGGMDQDAWLRCAVVAEDPYRTFVHLTTLMRTIWGTGRQSAFEWAEFVAKVLRFPATAPDAQLWESEGPRRSLQRIYGNPKPDRRWLEDRANECRQFLAGEGIPLSWEDFETVICDFNVMRDGRYYPGRHLAALKEEIDSVADVVEIEPLVRAWKTIVPEPWRDIEPGIKKPLLPLYRDTGTIVSEPC